MHNKVDPWFTLKLEFTNTLKNLVWKINLKLLSQSVRTICNCFPYKWDEEKMIEIFTVSYFYPLASIFLSLWEFFFFWIENFLLSWEFIFFCLSWEFSFDLIIFFWAENFSFRLIIFPKPYKKSLIVYVAYA